MESTVKRISELRNLIAQQDNLLISLSKKYIIDEIDRSTYEKVKLNMESERSEFEIELKELPGFSGRYKSLLVFLYRYASRLKGFYNESDLIIKHRILG